MRFHDTILLGLTGGLAIAAMYIFPILFYGATGAVPSFTEGALALIGALFIMSFVEHRLSRRGGNWRKVKYAFALAGALGLSIVNGYASGAGDEIFRFIILAPTALLTVFAADCLLAKSSACEED